MSSYDLTGSSVADSATLVSFPRVVLVNTSNNVITTFVVGIKNFKTGKIRGVSFGDKLIKPGDTFIVEPQQFILAERITITDANGKSRHTYKKHSIDSPQMWIPANNEELAIRVSVVHYENGEKWLATNTNW